MAKLTVTLEIEVADISEASGVEFSLRKGYGFPNPDVARRAKVTGYSIEWMELGADDRREAL